MVPARAIAVVEIKLVHKLGYVYASSDDVPGLHICGHDQAAVLADVPNAIKLLYSLNHQVEVDVEWAADPVSLKPLRRPTAHKSPVRKLLTFPRQQLAAA